MKTTAMAWTVAMACATGPAWGQDGGARGPENVVVRANVLFGFDSDAIAVADRERILKELGNVGKVTWQSVDAVGYTDSVGSAQYNKGLSERRAKAVKDYLVSKGVDGSMIATSGKGADDPVADNESVDGRAQNRRTMIEFQGVRAPER